MKKMIFYVTNTIVCAIFLNIRFAFLLFGDASKVDHGILLIINILTAVIATVMLINISFSYKESKK